jgi:hypothetical protein
MNHDSIGSIDGVMAGERVGAIEGLLEQDVNFTMLNRGVAGFGIIVQSAGILRYCWRKTRRDARS